MKDEVRIPITNLAEVAAMGLLAACFHRDERIGERDTMLEQILNVMGDEFLSEQIVPSMDKICTFIGMVVERVERT